MTNYNRIAPIYDSLTRIVFGKSLLDAQVHFLDTIQNAQRILIVGGGTGQQLLYFNQTNVTIDYVEPSHAMMARARQRKVREGTKVHFHLCELAEFVPVFSYDVILCPFVLDLFERSHLIKVIKQLKSMMHTESRLVVTDFELNKNRVWQNILSWSMHVFFRLLTSLKSKKLQPIHQLILEGAFKLEEEQLFYGSFIFSRKYVLS